MFKWKDVDEELPKSGYTSNMLIFIPVVIDGLTFGYYEDGHWYDRHGDRLKPASHWTYIKEPE